MFLLCLTSTAKISAHNIDKEKQDFLVYSLSVQWIVSIIQIYRPWTPRRTSWRIVNKKNWRENEAYRNFGKRFDWSFEIKRHLVMAAPIGETIWLVNGFTRHIIMTAPFAVTAPSSVQNLMSNSSRQFDGKSRSLDDRDYTVNCSDINPLCKTEAWKLVFKIFTQFTIFIP